MTEMRDLILDVLDFEWGKQRAKNPGYLQKLMRAEIRKRTERQNQNQNTGKSKTNRSRARA